MNNTLKSKEELPFKYFVVEKDNTQDYKDYIDWLNQQYDVNWGGSMY